MITAACIPPWDSGGLFQGLDAQLTDAGGARISHKVAPSAHKGSVLQKSRVLQTEQLKEFREDRMVMKRLESHKRSWAKSLIWRAIGIALLGGIGYAVTGNLEQMATITLIFNGLRVFLYYLHERIWDQVTWGRTRHPLADIPVQRTLAPEDRKALEDVLCERGYLRRPGVTATESGKRSP